MTFDKFTIKAQEAVQAAVNIAQRNGQQTIEPVHLTAYSARTPVPIATLRLSTT